MNRFKRKPMDAIPNPRDKRRRQAAYGEAQRTVLRILQAFNFTLAILILLEITNAPL